MKWGVRRYQNKDGSLTTAGKKRYSDEEPKEPKKSKHRQQLEAAYRKGGLSKEDAEYEADKRIRAEKILAISAGLTLTACAAYAANKYLKKRVDRVIESGTSFQRIEMKDTNGQLYNMFYASKGKHDNARYEGLLGGTRFSQTGKAYLMKLENQRDVKVASQHNAAKIFGDLMKNDPDFRKTAESYAKSHFSGRNTVNINDLSDRNIKKMYENFNSNLIHIRQGGSGADTKFYSKLKSAGYGAIQDINDMKYSGYRAKNPLIIFDNSDKNILVKSVKELNRSTINKKYAKEQLKISTVEPFLDTYGPLALTSLTAGLTAKTAQSYIEDREYIEDHK